MNPDDRRVVARQIGRPPRGDWRVVARCRHDAPLVIAISPLLEDGAPFPTTFWLTCPALVRAVADRESAGEHTEWTARAMADPDLGACLDTAADAYRAARSALAGGVDPCGATGVAGERDDRRVKCLHARVAAYLAGLPDPVGEAFLPRLRPVLELCDGTLCASVTASGYVSSEEAL